MNEQVNTPAKSKAFYPCEDRKGYMIRNPDGTESYSPVPPPVKSAELPIDWLEQTNHEPGNGKDDSSITLRSVTRYESASVSTISYCYYLKNPEAIRFIEGVVDIHTTLYNYKDIAYKVSKEEQVKNITGCLAGILNNRFGLNFLQFFKAVKSSEASNLAFSEEPSIVFELEQDGISAMFIFASALSFEPYEDPYKDVAAPVSIGDK